MVLNQAALVVLSALATTPSGDAVLRQVDEQLSKARSQVLTMEMIIEDPGREPRRIGMQMYMRGDQRRIAFLYPGDMKGMRVLNVSASQSYVYLPAFRKVRRIASHMRDQSMFGSDYTFDDFSTLSLGKTFDGEMLGEDDSTWTVRAAPKTGVDMPYSRIELSVDKKLKMPLRLSFFDAKGVNVRTETRWDYVCADDVCAPRRTKMVDHRHDGHWTEVAIKDLQLNSEFSDQIFSLRDFQRND